jgi:hypothetical protein
VCSKIVMLRSVNVLRDQVKKKRKSCVIYIWIFEIDRRRKEVVCDLDLDP